MNGWMEENRIGYFPCQSNHHKGNLRALFSRKDFYRPSTDTHQGKGRRTRMLRLEASACKTWSVSAKG